MFSEESILLGGGGGFLVSFLSAEEFIFEGREGLALVSGLSFSALSTFGGGEGLVFVSEESTLEGGAGGFTFGAATLIGILGLADLVFSSSDLVCAKNRKKKNSKVFIAISKGS